MDAPGSSVMDWCCSAIVGKSGRAEAETFSVVSDDDREKSVDGNAC